MTDPLDAREADERYDRLVADMATAADRLERAGMHHWARWVARARVKVVAGDSRGLSDLLAAYGGMGSFNDLYLDPETERLRSTMYDDAAALLRDLHGR